MALPDSDFVLEISPAQAGQRLDKALAALAPAAGLALSRSRLAQLIASGAVLAPDGREVHEPARKVKPGERYRLQVPPPVAAQPQPEAIPLAIVFEDADLLVVDKPAGMVVHPAPGAETGTLVNALLAHCGDTLPGIGGERRPGIVHRIDKDTSGLLVVAKTEAAHTALSRGFAAHAIDRQYRALVWGAIDLADPRLAGRPGVTFEAPWVRIETELGRHPQDRIKMAVVAEGGRLAISRLRSVERFGPADKPFAGLIQCQLETGRTHQIRVHAAHIGHALIGDPVYGRPRILPKRETSQDLRDVLTQFSRQALHAESLGFFHPITDERLDFTAPLPADMNGILMHLRRNG